MPHDLLGTATCSVVVFFAKGKGEIKLDKFHEKPVIITLEKYTEKFRKNLHPYVRDFMDIVIKNLNTNL